MTKNLLSDGASQPDRYCVSDLACHRPHASKKLEGIVEILKSRRFTYAQRPVLVGMSVAPVRKTYAPGRQCSCRAIFAKPSVDIRMALVYFVAIELEVVRPAFSAATGRRCPDPFEIYLRQVDRAMIGDLLAGLPCLQRGKIPDPSPHGLQFGSASAESVGRFRQLDRTEQASQKYEAPTVLWNSEILRFQYPRVVLVTKFVEQLNEAAHRSSSSVNFLKSGDILDENVGGPKKLDETMGFAEQCCARVLPVARCPLTGERLARSASRKQKRPLTASRKHRRQIGRLKVPNVFLKEFRLWKIFGERAPGIGVAVDPCEDFHAGITQSGTCASASAEEIYHLYHVSYTMRPGSVICDELGSRFGRLGECVIIFLGFPIQRLRFWLRWTVFSLPFALRKPRRKEPMAGRKCTPRYPDGLRARNSSG